MNKPVKKAFEKQVSVQVGRPPALNTELLSATQQNDPSLRAGFSPTLPQKKPGLPGVGVFDHAIKMKQNNFFRQRKPELNDYLPLATGPKGSRARSQQRSRLEAGKRELGIEEFSALRPRMERHQIPAFRAGCRNMTPGYPGTFEKIVPIGDRSVFTLNQI